MKTTLISLILVAALAACLHHVKAPITDAYLNAKAHHAAIETAGKVGN